MKKSKTVLATTYAVNPYKGSEDAMGWNYVKQIARNFNVIAVTRENNRVAIEEYMAENPDPAYERITFLYFDLPYWMRFWKKGSRGALLYYWMWQRAIPGFIRRQAVEFDIVHNLNFHNDWTPSYLWKLNKPFVWGPIGHHPMIPRIFRERMSLRQRIKERLTWWVKSYFWHKSSDLRNTIEHSSFIWCMNSSVPRNLSFNGAKMGIGPSVAADEFKIDKPVTSPIFHLISAGRFVPLKGFDLTLKGFATFSRMLSPEARKVVKLTLVGKGPEKESYHDFIAKNNLGEVVEIIEWIERPKLMQMMSSASAFVFPSHEGAGMVVPEALSHGLPVICLDNYGPGEFVNENCGIIVPIDTYDQVITDIASAMYTLYSEPDLLKEMSKNAKQHFYEKFDWKVRGQQLKAIYDRL